MRRILVDDKVKKIAKRYADEIFEGRRKKFDHPKDKLERLKVALVKTGANDIYIKYVEKTIEYFDDKTILQATPSQMYALIDEFDKILTENGGKSEDIVKVKLPFSTSKDKQVSAKELEQKEFYQHIVDALRYEDVVRVGIIKYLAKLNIKTCVYCNAQYAVSVKENGKYRGRYELDHFHPKSKYPFLCVNFYNLQPSCSSCNRAKGKSLLDFNLYTEKSEEIVSPFLFALDDKSLLSYLFGICPESINIEFKDNPDNNERICDNHDKVLHISSLYACHRDVAADLVTKRFYYNSAYKNVLSNAYRGKLHPDIINRILYGFHTNPEDIHLRPLNKMQQDIARQLGLNI